MRSGYRVRVHVVQRKSRRVTLYLQQLDAHFSCSSDSTLTVVSSIIPLGTCAVVCDDLIHDFFSFDCYMHEITQESQISKEDDINKTRIVPFENVGT